MSHQEASQLLGQLTQITCICSLLLALWGRGGGACCPPPSGQPRTFREAAAGLRGAPGLRSSRLASGLWFPSSCFRCGGRKFAGGGRARSRPATRSCFPATWKGPLGATESREPLPHLPTHPSMPGVKAVRAARTRGLNPGVCLRVCIFGFPENRANNP